MKNEKNVLTVLKLILTSLLGLKILSFDGCICTVFSFADIS